MAGRGALATEEVTSLRLAVVGQRNRLIIVKQSAGHILVSSEVGLGTTIKTFFPAIRLVESDTETGATELAVRHGHETILVVEDEGGVRKIAQLALESFGYRVLAASSGHAALQLVDEHRGEIRLVVTDVVMHEMSGRQLAEILAQRHPGLKILFMSGYTDDAIVRHGIIEKKDSFLQKPFSPVSLARKVREILDAK